MIQASGNSAKRNRIISIDYLLVSESTINDYPGNYIQVLSTGWISVKYSSIEFTEEDEGTGDFITQKLDINLFGSDDTMEQAMKSIIGKEIIIRLTYATGQQKIVGTGENPVILQHTSSGSPVKHTLSFERNSSEKAKIPL